MPVEIFLAQYNRYMAVTEVGSSRNARCLYREPVAIGLSYTQYADVHHRPSCPEACRTIGEVAN